MSNPKTNIMKINDTKDIVKLIKDHGAVVRSEDEEFLLFPYWIREDKREGKLYVYEANSPQLPDMCKEVYRTYSPTDNERSFLGELTNLINKHSKENGSDTPDFILAEYLKKCLEAFDGAVMQRHGWYGGSQKENNLEE